MSSLVIYDCASESRNIGGPDVAALFEFSLASITLLSYYVVNLYLQDYSDVN